MELRTCGIKYLDFHHTAGNEKNTQEVKAEHIKPKNQGGKGWDDIGYNSVIEPDGTVGTGRDIIWAGAHDPGKAPGESLSMNYLAYSISSIGNFEINTMSEIQYQGLLREAIRAAKAFNVPVECFRRHKDQYATACPGKNFPWNRLLADVKAVLQPASINNLDPDINLLVWVRTSKAPDLVKQIINMGYACQQLPIPLSKINK